jgi:hypothetical protein
MSFDITFQITELFFDRAAVQERVGKQRNRALMTAGAYSGEPNVRTVLFFLDPSTDSMVAGPVKLNAAKRLKSNRSTVPELMEFGGEAEVLELSPDRGKTWITLDESRKAKYRGTRFRSRMRKATFAAHPYMSVALDQALPDVPEHFRDLI